MTRSSTGAKSVSGIRPSGCAPEWAQKPVLSGFRPVDAGEATRLLVNRLLHDPSQALRGGVADRDNALDGAVRRLYRLDDTLGKSGE